LGGRPRRRGVRAGGSAPRASQRMRSRKHPSRSALSSEAIMSARVEKRNTSLSLRAGRGWRRARCGYPWFAARLSPVECGAQAAPTVDPSGPKGTAFPACSAVPRIRRNLIVSWQREQGRQSNSPRSRDAGSVDPTGSAERASGPTADGAALFHREVLRSGPRTWKTDRLGAGCKAAETHHVGSPACRSNQADA
jgi:hypothetical protein